MSSITVSLLLLYCAERYRSMGDVSGWKQKTFPHAHRSLSPFHRHRKPGYLATQSRYQTRFARFSSCFSSTWFSLLVVGLAALTVYLSPRSMSHTT
ncbi:hypothetical protein EXIGLDRAFT_416851 [Exidia glandulosa HHB12029]|uniref:Uncharacterized protein n=1 Tax=Exidia glandulosa HHB12029 TaxID=1314781 RepID=A0A165PSN6_EXIGL|nr:hypothetical protein EXIGLDRAFT_416851 [Exidia glandulosa HHB12029]